MMNDLEQIRKKIDRIDDSIGMLLVKRLELSLRVGELKKMAHTPVIDSAREQSILSRISQQIPDELNNEIIGIFKTIIEYSRKLQSHE